MSQVIARTAAHAAYQAAVADPAAVNWRELAETLFSALPALPKAARDSRFPMWWAEYPLPRAYLTDSMDVLFADGEEIRVNIHRAPRGLPRVPEACRVAIGFYRARHGHGHAVPAFASLTVTDTGATFDAEACSRFTVEARAIPGTVAGRAVTLDSIARMRAELARRREGLARAMTDGRAFTSASLDAWHNAVAGGVAELAHMLDAYAAQRGEAAPAGAPLDAEEAIGHLLDWHDGLPVEAELAGTFDAETGTLNPLESPLHSAPVAPIAPAVAPYVAVVAAAEIATSIEDDWYPDERTHPVVALALSHKAREELFARVMDGTFPDGERTAKCGAWRLTVQDALDLQDIASVRWVGMPRKPYTRKAVAAKAATPTTSVIAVAQPAPAAYAIPAGSFYPGSLRPDCAVVHHGPSM